VHALSKIRFDFSTSGVKSTSPGQPSWAASLETIRCTLDFPRTARAAHGIAAAEGVRPDAVEMAYFNHGRQTRLRLGVAS
jgi:hypothetical protein